MSDHTGSQLRGQSNGQTSGQPDGQSAQPAAARPPLRYPTRTKLVVAVVLALAIGGFVLAGMSTDTDTDDEITVTGGPAGGTGSAPVPGEGAPESDGGVVEVEPRDGTEALAQERVRIQLSAGWTGELTLLPASGPAVPLPPDEVEVTALNELVFVPAEGRVIERLPSGRNCVRATIWDQVDGREATERLHSWCFDVT
jgi:hypothetical protein